MAMPLLGYLAGTQFRELASRMDHWIAFVLLSLIGGLMIRESFHPKEENADSEVSFRIMLPLAVATSIDALVTGITFAFLSVNIWAAVGAIGAVTFLLCAAGVEMGRVLGRRLEKRARLLGGIVLILIGLYAIWVFACVARFENTTGRMMKNALYLTAGNLPFDILILLAFAGAAFVIWLMPPLVLLMPGVAMWLSSELIERAFRRNMTPEQRREEDERNMEWKNDYDQEEQTGEDNGSH
jgi:putative Mn2+ efflux pump MntP